METPKCSKHTLQNNPWITHSIIVSVNQCDTLYHKWRKSRKKKCKEGEKDDRGGACMCEICSQKRYFYTQYKEQNQGKNKRQIKPQFVINNEKITDRRIIANEFNKYFVSMASNLNNAYHEIGQL